MQQNQQTFHNLLASECHAVSAPLLVQLVQLHKVLTASTELHIGYVSRLYDPSSRDNRIASGCLRIWTATHAWRQQSQTLPWKAAEAMAGLSWQGIVPTAPACTTCPEKKHVITSGEAAECERLRRAGVLKWMKVKRTGRFPENIASVPAQGAFFDNVSYNFLSILQSRSYSMPKQVGNVVKLQSPFRWNVGFIMSAKRCFIPAHALSTAHVPAPKRFFLSAQFWDDPGFEAKTPKISQTVECQTMAYDDTPRLR